MNVIPADTRPHHWRGPGGRHGSFHPNAKLLFVGNQDSFKKNPELWTSDDPMLASRIFVGFNVGGAPAWTVDDLIDVVSKLRKAQGHDPDASFLVQKGVYTSKQSGETVTEDSAQVIILNTSGEPRAEFEKEMIQLAEDVAKTMKQEEVIVEIQKGGITQKTFGVAA